jgi:hypothetical protein
MHVNLSIDVPVFEAPASKLSSREKAVKSYPMPCCKPTQGAVA